MAYVALTRKPSAFTATDEVVFEWVCDPIDATVVYRLEPVDERSFGPTTARRATYPMLPDGAYVFRIQAQDELGNLSPEVVYSFQVSADVDQVAAAKTPTPVPLTAPMPVRRRGVALSHDQNVFRANVAYDLANIALMQTAIRAKVSDALAMWNAEVSLYNARIDALKAAVEHEIESLVASHYGPGEPHTRLIHPSNMRPGVPEELVPSYGNPVPAMVDVECGVVTLAQVAPPQDRLAYRHPTTGRTLPISNVATYLSPVGAGITDGPISCAVDGDPTTAWIRNVMRPAGWSEPEEAVVAFDLPLGLTNNPGINTVALTPFPEGLVDVLSVSYRSYRSSLDDPAGWEVLPGFPCSVDPQTGQNVPSPIEEAFATKWCFADVQAHAVRVHLRARHYRSTSEGTQYIFGIKTLSVWRSIYSQDVCYAHMALGPLSPSLPYATFRIASVTPAIANSSCISPEQGDTVVTFDYYLKQPDGTYAPFEISSPLIGADELLIVMGLRQDPLTRVTPAVARVEVTYSRIT